jgi:membrane-associated protease RseP (regulator of RpoE activity)
MTELTETGAQPSLSERLAQGVAGGYGVKPMRGGPEPSRKQQRGALLRLAVAVAVVVGLAAAGHALTPVAVIAVLAAVIMLHEAGHFVVAKLSGMKVTEYFLGFGPRLWSTRRGETEYGVKALPVGGYVRIVGMNNLEKVDPADEPRTYRAQSFPKRFAVAVAGSSVHFVLAFLALWALNAFVGVTRYDKSLPIVDEIAKLTTGQSPAQAAGFRVGDHLISVDGAPITNFDKLRDHIRSHAGEPIHFIVERDGQRLALTAVPLDLSKLSAKDQASILGDQTLPPGPDGFLGIAPKSPVERADPLTAVGRAGREWGSGLVLTFKAVGSVFSPHGIGQYGGQLVKGPGAAQPGDANRLVSVVGVVRVAGTVAHQGAEPLLLLFMSVNMFIGVLNLFPLLPFDGGHVAIAVYERLRSRKGRRYQADVARMLPATYAVVLVLMFIFVSSLYLDIVRPLSLN